MSNNRLVCSLVAASCLVALSLSAPSWGKNGNGNGGGGNGGGGGSEPATVTYSITYLGTLGGNDSVAEGMNEAGDIVGWSETETGDQHAFLSTSNGVMIDLNYELSVADQARWILKQAFDINDSGQIVGVGSWLDESRNYVGRRAFRLTPGTSPTIENLGTLGGDSSSAMGINDDGEVVGTSLAPDPNSNDPDAYVTRAFLYADLGNGEEMIDLGLIGGADATFGASINDRAETAGFSTFGGGLIYRAWRSDGIMQNLGVIAKNRGNIEESSAAHIRNNGEVVGWSTAGGRKYHAFRYSNGGMQDLGTLGGDNSAATGINDEYGDAVGWAETGDGVRHVFVHTAELGMARVEIVGGLEGELYNNIQCKINNLGEISGTLTDDNGNHQAFVLEPAP